LGSKILLDGIGLLIHSEENEAGGEPGKFRFRKLGAGR
jgi:hypothetical protein